MDQKKPGCRRFFNAFLPDPETGTTVNSSLPKQSTFGTSSNDLGKTLSTSSDLSQFKASRENSAIANDENTKGGKDQKKQLETSMTQQFQNHEPHREQSVSEGSDGARLRNSVVVQNKGAFGVQGRDKGNNGKRQEPTTSKRFENHSPHYNGNKNPGHESAIRQNDGRRRNSIAIQYKERAKRNYEVKQEPTTSKGFVSNNRSHNGHNNRKRQHQPTTSKQFENHSHGNNRTEGDASGDEKPRTSQKGKQQERRQPTIPPQRFQNEASDSNMNKNYGQGNGRRINSVGVQDKGNENQQEQREPTSAQRHQNYRVDNPTRRMNDNRKKNHVNFFGYKKLENYLKSEADSVVISLHSDIETFEEFLKSDKAYEQTMFDMILKVLSEKVFSDESNLSSYQNDIVKLVSSTDIMNRFRDECMTLEDNQFQFMYNIANFMKRRMPISAVDSLSGLLTFCIARLGMDQANKALQTQFQDLFAAIHEKKKLEEVAEKARKAPVRGKFTESDLKSFDKLKPPDNFREINVIPTVEELLSKEPSFLRPNKQSGSYTDSDHYLDVQFRLLREDFMQPLKQGIQDYLLMRQKTNNPKMPKGSPIRLYYNVKCHAAEVRNESLHYWIELDSTCSKINWQKSRRLLPGNLVLLTKNTTTFDSVVFATVGMRNEDTLKKERKLTIIPETTISTSDNVDVLCDGSALVLIESEIYWESFRHVLKTAQILELNSFPLAKYIVRACTNVDLPPSLQSEDADGNVSIFSLNISFRSNLSSADHDSEGESEEKLPTPLVHGANWPNLLVPLQPVKQRNFTVQPLISGTWPSGEELGLDTNQFEAFKAALTKQFVIIQGPPGTGKTFVGLRIAEIILQNPVFRTGKRRIFANGMDILSEYAGPLLCICYTNHALDQFLEGILKIMRTYNMDPKIVRVGGRSKSSVLSEFNLRDVARRTARNADGLHWRELRDIEDKVKQNESSIKALKRVIAELEQPTGIVQFDTLRLDRILADINIYQTLCLEFSTQLITRLASPSFFKLAHNDVYRIKENDVTNIVKKWFDYLKSIRNANIAQTKDIIATTEAGDEIEELYDMEELMEHRIITEDDQFEVLVQYGNDKSMANFHVENLSVLRSRCTIREYNVAMQKYTINESDSLKDVYAKKRKEAEIHDQKTLEEKRLAILSEIFRCLNEKLVKIPDVSNQLELLKNVNTMDPDRIVDENLPLVSQRYAAYLAVANRAKQLLQQGVRQFEKEMLEKTSIVAQLRRQHEVQILKNAVVVGMTTTGAAKFNDLLVKMRSRIVIVEEAAEVLEAHIVTSLTKYTDHLILIGDHQQLKPSTAVYDLSRKYDLDVSLFERMINNKMTCYSLLAQHRMRPEIADLIRGSIYNKLNDSPNVLEYESVRGITKDLFFLTHEKFEKSEGDTLSKLNEFEADFLAGLAGHLLKQGYEPSSITVLTTYTGQMFILKSRFRTLESLKQIQITCVDNFQGEENEIILLSLVRSNPEGRMGFLSVSNRVCVALSRAKKGLYIVGNMKMLSKQNIWSEINSKLEKRGEIGNAMKVVCQAHKTESEISKGEDFAKKCPEGGCSKSCGILIKCNHQCTRFCHSQDLDHQNYECQERCKKPCVGEKHHPCKFKCHFGKVCVPCDVKIVKPRSCGHDIKVSCHKDPEEAYCTATVERVLKCDHEVKVDCSQIMDNWLCRKLLDKVLACGHETKLMCYFNPDEYKCQVEVKKTLPCSHPRNMKCFEKPLASMCKTLVDKKLPCGHTQKVECRFDVKKVICEEKVIAALECGHSLEVKCYRKTKGKIDCVEFCEERLNCGHSCPLKCHYFKDRHHNKFKCKKPCAKSCPEGHKCMTNHECSSQCKRCLTVVERQLPNCGHIGKMYCFESLTAHNCEAPCTKKLDCGHLCPKKCFQTCGSCKEMVIKQVPTCHHNKQVQCGAVPVPENCEEEIKLKSTLCGHEISVPCNMRNASPEEIQAHCTQRCEFTFPEKDGCGHRCSGTCGTCLMGSLHQKCKKDCSRLLICGHRCNFPCAKNCPPCKEKCQMRCEHSKCKKMCGDECFICKEPCSWKCKHQRCRKLCGEMCNRGPCHEPCDKKLRCGHSCVGFCGEKCPPLCRVCNKDKLTEFQLLYTEEEDDARFIWLPDCQHAIEVEGLTMHFNANDSGGEIGLKKCPRCTTVITTLAGRFGNIIKKTYKEVAEVKRQYYGNNEQNQRLSDELHQNLIKEESNLKNSLPLMKTYFENILYFKEDPNVLKISTPNLGNFEKRMRPVDIPTLNSLQQIWVWVSEIIKNLKEFSDAGTLKNCLVIFGNIVKRQLPLSRFEVNNISKEIERLVDVIQLNHRWNSAPEYSRKRPDAIDLHSKVLDALQSKGFYDETSKRKVLKGIEELEKLLRTGINISQSERMEIIKALDMKQGHWFKCPNGHPYIITECGGAMITSTCNECGETIGGGNHALLQTNQFAPEMDGAGRPAWDTVLVPQNFGF